MKETDIEILELLPFKVKNLIQAGEMNCPMYILELENNKRICMGRTSEFLSSVEAYQRLFDRGYFLSEDAIENWQQITVALRLLAPMNHRFHHLE
ncbi:hypothetical protein ACFLVO_02385 [Chloroflexota bacterium]